MTTKNDILDQNVESLLHKSYDPPRLDDTARARIRQALIDKHAHAHTRRAIAPVLAIGGGLLAAATAAIVVARIVGDDPPADGAVKRDGQEMTLPDGTTALLADGAAVDVLGPRHVRVRGAVMLDVAPGKGTFTVATANGDIAVLGTRFIVDASPAQTLAAVIRGEVRLSTPAGNVLLHAGEQGLARLDAPPTREPAPRLSHLASWVKNARRRDEGKTQAPVRNGSLFARDPNFQDQEFPLPMSRLAVDIVVDSQVARVALDQTFENPQPRELEGVYRFAIPSDAALQRFAMYVDGVLTESAVVERMRARRIYEDLVYRRIDPGLLEWTGAGRLSMRIYPLRAQQDKRLVLAYTQSLARLYDDWTLTVPFPEVDGAVGEVDMKVRVKGCAGCELKSPSHDVAIAADGADAIVTYTARGERIGDSLVLVARDARREARLVEHVDGDHRYVVVRARPELGAKAGEHRRRSWVIVDDVSASRGAIERRAQADVLDRLLREIDEDDRAAVLTVDAIVREHGPLTRVDDIDRRAVRAFVTADDVGGVGATDLGAAFDRAVALLDGGDARDAYVVYLGDGVITGGERNLTALRNKLAGKATFVGVGIGDGADTPTMTAFADATGGAVATFDLADDLGWRTFDLVASLYTPRVTGVTATLVDRDGRDIAATAYLRAGQLGDGEELELIARAPASAKVGSVRLAGQLGGQPWQHAIRIADTARSSEASYTPRLWAHRHIAALLLAKDDAVVVPPCAGEPCKSTEQVISEHREKIRLDVVALGKQHFLLSRHTSLIVLENDAMYAQYGVVKGAGKTWQPYSVPAKVAVKTVSATSTTAPGIDPAAILIRTPIARFHVYPTIDHHMDWQVERRGADPFMLDSMRGGGGDEGSLLISARRELEMDRSRQAGPVTSTSTPMPDQPRDPHAGVPSGAVEIQAETKAEASGKGRDVSLSQAEAAEDNDGDMTITTAELQKRSDTWMVGGESAGAGFFAQPGQFAVTLASGRGGWRAGGVPYPMAFNYPTDVRLDDVTEHVPAMFADAVDIASRELDAVARRNRGSIDDAARALIARARQVLPRGHYRIGDGASIVVGDGGVLSWRTLHPSGLDERATFDGTTWRRAYPELGLDVTRALGERSPALLWSYMPLLVPDADHLARWFVVATKGARTLTLTPAGDPKAKPMLTIELDDRHRVVAIKTAAGTTRLAVTWGAQGPTSARVDGVDTPIGYSSGSAADPAMPAAGTLVTVAMPLHTPMYWRAKIAKLATGTDDWRDANRQLMASLVAVGDASSLAATYLAVLDHGGTSLGDLTLAGRGIAQASDADHQRAIAPHVQSALARYLAASRAYGKQPRPEALAPAVTDGVIGGLWRYREVLALIVANRREAAVARLEAMSDTAPDLRMIAASSIAQRWDWPGTLVARAWDAVARGPIRNLARYEAARALSQRGDHAAAGDRFAAAMAEVDLTAEPLHVDHAAIGAIQSSPRGNAGFEMAWRAYADRVLSDGSFDHVVALATSAGQLGRPTEIDRAIGRAAEIAGDRQRLIGVVRLAVALGQNERAAALMPLVTTGEPDAGIERLASQLAIQQGRTAEAADHLETAMQLDRGPAPLASVRADFMQLLALRGRVAQLAFAGDRDKAVASLVSISRRWRDIDPANQMIDRTIGELLLGLGKTDEAWRQLSTAIERAPMEGDGWILVADLMERHGRHDRALDLWHQAVVIDQTNPMPRLRKAQLLYALGRTADGDAVLRDAAKVRWHERHWVHTEQLRSLIRQRKLDAPVFDPSRSTSRPNRRRTR